MDTETEKIIKDQLSKLPDEVKTLFVDPRLNDKIVIIGKKYSLNIEQLGILQTEIMLVMLGLTHPDGFPTELKSHLRIDDEEVNNLIVDINREILSDIKEKLKEVYDKTNRPEEKESENYTQPVAKSTPDGINLDEASVLDSAGIKILDPSVKVQNLKTLEINAPKNPVSTSAPILSQKLSDSVQMPTVKTEHAPENISKPSPAPAPAPYPPKSDPYRLPPE